MDGILRLISTNPKKDKYELQKLPLKERVRSILPTDNSPLRYQYLEALDLVIYKIVFNYFKAAENVLFDNAPVNSSIIRTIGIQGLFDALRRILNQEKDIDRTLKTADLRKERFVKLFDEVRKVDFSSDFFQFSGVGRGNITDVLLVAGGYIEFPREEDAKNEKDLERINKRINHLNQVKELIKIDTQTSDDD
ncbi:ParB N-terminal domain-containing protein [Spirosoma arcticum]